MRLTQFSPIFGWYLCFTAAISPLHIAFIPVIWIFHGVETLLISNYVLLIIYPCLEWPITSYRLLFRCWHLGGHFLNHQIPLWIAFLIHKILLKVWVSPQLHVSILFMLFRHQVHMFSHRVEVASFSVSSSLIHRITILLSTCLLWCEQYFRSTVFIDYCDHLIYICAFLRVAVFVPISRHNLSTVTQCLAIYHVILSYPCYVFISLHFTEGSKCAETCRKWLKPPFCSQ